MLDITKLIKAEQQITKQKEENKENIFWAILPNNTIAEVYYIGGVSFLSVVRLVEAKKNINISPNKVFKTRQNAVIHLRSSYSTSQWDELLKTYDDRCFELISKHGKSWDEAKIIANTEFELTGDDY